MPPGGLSGRPIIGAAPLVWSHLVSTHELEPPAAGQAMAIAWTAEANDGNPVYGGVLLLAGGRPDIFSEVALRDEGEWREWIRKQAAKPSVTAVWCPDAARHDHFPEADNLQWYNAEIPPEAASGIPPARRGRGTRKIAAGVAAVLVAGAVLLFAGGGGDGITALIKRATDSITSLWREPPPEIARELWILRQDIEAAEILCDTALSWPWPVSPEWTLQEEGCAFDVRVEHQPGSSPWPSTVPRNFAWRYYRLSPGFTPWLAARAAERMEERFTGEVTREGESDLVYVLEIVVPELESRDGEYAAVPDNEIMPLLRAASLGVSTQPPQQSGRGGWVLASTLGRRSLLSLVTDLRLSPRVIWVDMSTGYSSVEVVREPLRNDWREVPGASGGGT